MHLIKYLLALIPVAGAAVAPRVPRCSTPELPAETIAEHNAIYDAYRNSTSFNSLATTDVVIPTYVHIVTTDAKRNKYTYQMIQDQIHLMNRVYKFMGISFNWVGTDFNANNEWARASVNGQAERSMRTFLQKQIAHYTTLNLYFLSDFSAETGEPLLGYCRFPVKNPTYDDYLLDGCLNSAETLPNGGSQQYGIGYTAAHEVGHWLDLYHPFPVQPSCDHDGDFVTDTPVQAYPSFGCDYGKDTCPQIPGKDSIHNIMDYSDDYCLTHFSQGQSDRARISFEKLRAPRA